MREAAVTSSGVEEFVEALGAAGYLVELRRAPSGDPIGFKVARPGDVGGAGQLVFYSGSKLAADLSLPTLRQRWADSVGGPADASAAVAVRQVARARRAVAAARRGLGVEDADEIAHATGDVLVALRRSPGHALGEAADLFDRAARAPGRGVGRAGPSSVGLRRLARHLVRQRRGGVDPGAAVALAVAVVALVREIAAWQRERGRTHQADSADAAAGVVDRWSAAARAGRKVPARRARPDLDRGATAVRPPRAPTPRLSPPART